MKITFIAPNYYPHIGGVEKHIREITRELSKDGHHITIYVEKYNNSYKDYEKYNNTEIIRYSKINVRIIKKLHLYGQVLKHLHKIIKSDVIHFHDFSVFWSWVPFVLIFKLLRKRLFITFHGWEGDVPPRKEAILIRKICEKLTRGNICVGHFIEKWYGTRADIVTYGGVSEVKNITNKENVVLFVGRLAQDTGIIEYITAWKTIAKEYPSYRLIVCGDGPLKNKLRDQVKHEAIANIHFEGSVSDVGNYLARSKIVFTSGYLGILEAFSYKNAVIATYDNELKKDYLEMMPNSKAIMWIAKGSEEIIVAFRDSIKNTKRQTEGYKYSLDRDWSKVKNIYYALWNK